MARVVARQRAFSKFSRAFRSSRFVIFTSTTARPARADQIGPRLDRRAIAGIFRTQGRVHIPDVLTASSGTLCITQLDTRPPWQLSLNVGQRHVDIAHQQLMLMRPEQRETVAKKMLEQSRRGFQYVFENYPLYDLYQSGERAHPKQRLAAHALGTPDFGH